MQCLLPRSIYLPAPSGVTTIDEDDDDDSGEHSHSHAHSHAHAHAAAASPQFPGEGHSLLQGDSLLESYEASQVSSETLRERVRTAAEKRAKPIETV